MSTAKGMTIIKQIKTQRQECHLSGLPLLKLMQLCSVNLPVGAYAFSQGLETAVEHNWLSTVDDSFEWLQQQLEYSLARCDLPVLMRQLAALGKNETEQYHYWNEFILACRETRELQLADTATGKALIRVLKGLEMDLSIVETNSSTTKQTNNQVTSKTRKKTDISFVSAFALAASQWRISEEDACLGYAWSWLENQVAAATKLVPLGQTQAQQLLHKIQPLLVAAVNKSKQCSDKEIGASMPGIAIASCWHEQQYSRLFRS